MSETVRVNGETRPLTAESLIEVLRGLEVDSGGRGVAVALNGAVVPRRDWAAVTLHDGDNVEIVKLFAGG